MLKKITKRILKIILWILVTLFALDLLIVTLIIIPPVQQFIVLKVSKILTNITGGEITVDKIYLSPTLTLTAKNFAIKDHHFENMIFATKLNGRINLAKTFQGEVCLSFAQLDDGAVVLRRYKGEEKVNIAVWAMGLKKKERKEPSFKLLFENIVLNNVRFVYINDEKRLYKDDSSIDYGFFELQHINLNVDNFLVYGPDISCKISSLTLSQYTGFEISSFSGNFRIYQKGLILDSLYFTTPNSIFSGDFAFRYDDFSDFSEFVNQIHFDTKVKNASIAMQDVIFFAPKLKGMNNQFILSGYVGGTIQHLQTKNLYLKYKQQTYLVGDFSMENILNFSKSSFDVRLKDSYVNFSELAQFNLPKGKRINLPTIVNKLTYSNIRGNYSGTLTNFNTNLVVNTQLGKIEIDLRSTPHDTTITYSGRIDGNNIALGNLLSQSKYLNKINLSSSIEGVARDNGNIGDLFSSISVKIRGKITELDICDYSLKDIFFRGTYKQKEASVVVRTTDSLASFSMRGKVNFAQETPKVDASLINVTIKLTELLSYYKHPIDTNAAKGFEKLIWKVKQTPNLVFTVDSIAIDMSGNNLDNINGFLRVDYAKLSNGEKASRIDWLRLNAIHKPNSLHQYLIHTNFVNLSFKTNYDYKDGIAAIANAAQYYIPDFIEHKSNMKHIASTDSNRFINLDVKFFYSRNFFDLILPKLNISRDATVSIYLGNSRNEDLLNIFFPQINYSGLGNVNNLKINGNMNDRQEFELQIQTDSLCINKKEDKLTFSNIEINTTIDKHKIGFQTSWINPKSFSVHQLNKLDGMLFEDSCHNTALQISDSKLWLREGSWKFIGENNKISFSNNGYKFDRCVLTSDIGKISVHGGISKFTKEKCSVLFENFDISLLNSFTSKLKMTFGGNMSLIANVNSNIDHFTVDGKTFIKNFVFNNELLGDMFLDASILENGNPNFSGGILSSNNHLNINLSEFNKSNYTDLPHKMMNLKGVFISKDKELRVHAEIDTLKIGFLSPFLASFSNVVSGEAAGSLDFVMNPDSLYFDGKVIVKEAKLGISPLNTVYSINNQEILFNREGIEFNQIALTDRFNNVATLFGTVHHKKFKDFIIDLNISTPNILAMNTIRKVDAPFFGDGFVSGDISIQGDTKQLNFSSHNIKTLSGSTITFPLSSASTVSSSKGIYFVQNNENKTIVTDNKPMQSSTIMNFDFVFDITRDADVKLELDPIDGVLKCKTSGKLHLTYNTNSNHLNLDGILSIVSGKFHMSLKNLFPRDFTIVEGGTITFAGPLTTAQLNVSALYQKSALLSSLNPNLGRTDVSAYLGLNGNLMNPNPSFTFEFPRLTTEEQFEVFTALDTANHQNGIRQFFSFVFLNTFITSESNINAQQQSLGTGIDLVSGILNSFLLGESNRVNIGVNYNNKESYNEYSVNLAVNFLNDRLSFRTSLGMGYDNTGENNSNTFVGDFGLDVHLNENWKLNVFYFNDQTNSNNNSDIARPQQGGGIGLKYSQDFNNKNDFAESWKVKKREKKTKKE